MVKQHIMVIVYDSKTILLMAGMPKREEEEETSIP
jgi:hypothetical protein